MQFDVVAGPDALGEIHAALDSFWLSNPDVPVTIRMQMLIAATEIAANIMEHAGASELTVAIHCRPHDIQIEFADPGAPAEVDLASVRMPDDMAERGRGLGITKSITRDLCYLRDGGCNHWRCVSHEF